MIPAQIEHDAKGFTPAYEITGCPSGWVEDYCGTFEKMTGDGSTCELCLLCLLQDTL